MSTPNFVIWHSLLGEGGRYFKLLNIVTDLPTPITCKSGGFEKQAQKNLEIRTSNLETSKICVK